MREDHSKTIIAVMRNGTGARLLMRAGAQTSPQSLETRASIAGFRKMTAIRAVIGQPPDLPKGQRLQMCFCKINLKRKQKMAEEFLLAAKTLLFSP
jgi:hypothetical protein